MARTRNRDTAQVMARARAVHATPQKPTVADLYRWRINAARTDGDDRLIADLQRALDNHLAGGS